MKIQIKKLKIKNFISIQDAEINFENSGLWLIYGRILNASSNSNGVGKSTIIDALLWCLFDNTLRGVSKDSIVNNIAKKNCFVELELHIDKDIYLITRYRKDSKMSNQVVVICNGVDLSFASDKETNRLIEKILGFSFESFQENIVFSNNSLRFMQQGDTVKKQIFDTVIKSEIYEKAIDFTKLEVLSLDKKYEKIHNDFILKKAEYDSLESHIKDLEKISLKFEEEKQKEIQQVEKQINDIPEDNIEYGELQQPKNVEPEKIKELTELDKNRTIFKTNYTNQKEKFDSTSKNIAKLEYKKLELEKNKDSGICPMCGQKLTTQEHINNEIDKIDEEIEELLLSQKDMMEKMKDLEQKGKKNKEEYEQLKIMVEKDNELYWNQLNEYEELKKKKDKKIANDEKIKQLQEFLENIKKRENTSVKLIIDSKEKLVIVEEEMKKLEIEEKSILLKQEDTKYWISGFKKIKGLLISIITPTMNNLAKKYSDIISDGEFQIEFVTQKENKDGNIKDVFDVSIQRQNGGSTYDALSSGEKRRVDLIIMFVLDELKRMNDLNDLNIRFLDEVCDSLDASGIASVMKLFQQEAQTKQIFIISHNDELKGQFENTIELVKENGITRIIK